MEVLKFNSRAVNRIFTQRGGKVGCKAFHIGFWQELSAKRYRLAYLFDIAADINNAGAGVTWETIYFYYYANPFQYIGVIFFQRKMLRI